MRFRTAWYQEQAVAAEAERIARKPVGRKRRPPNAPESWNGLRRASLTLTRQLQDLLELLHQPELGERAPEIVVSLVADLVQPPPQTLEPPTRSRPVNLMGRHRVARGGAVEENRVLAKLELSVKAVIWSSPGKAPPGAMTRSTWILPTESAGKREKRYEKPHREK